MKNNQILEYYAFSPKRYNEKNTSLIDEKSPNTVKNQRKKPEDL